MDLAIDTVTWLGTSAVLISSRILLDSKDEVRHPRLIGRTVPLMRGRNVSAPMVGYS